MQELQVLKTELYYVNTNAKYGNDFKSHSYKWMSISVLCFGICGTCKKKNLLFKQLKVNILFSNDQNAIQTAENKSNFY